MPEEFVNIVEYYDEKGVCRKRTANGVDMFADTEPSVVFMKGSFRMEDMKWASQKRTMTKEEFRNIYPNLI